MDGGGMAWFGLCGFGALVKGWDICGTHPALRATLSFADAMMLGLTRHCVPPSLLLTQKRGFVLESCWLLLTQ